jgi:hypothetical protein
VRHLMIWLLAALALSGCRYGEKMLMAGGGTPVSEDTGSDSVTPNGGDTGGPIDDDTGPSGNSGVPPSVLDVDVSVEEYPDIGWVIEVTLTYADPDQDVEGGLVVLDVALDDVEPAQLQIPIDGSQAIHDAEDGTVFLAVQIPDSNASGNMTVFLQDANGNRSDPFEVNVS